MASKFNFDEIKEVLVTYNDGTRVLYNKKTTIEKFRNLMVDSVKPIEVISSDSESVEEIAPKTTVKQTSKMLSSPGGGYQTHELNYGVNKGQSAYEMAKELQKGAMASGISWNG